MMSNQLRKPIINIGLIVAIEFILCTPMLSGMVNNITKLAIMSLWYIEVFSFEGRTYFPKKFACFLLIWWMYEMLLYFIGFSSAAVGNYYNTLLFFDVVIKSVYVLHVYNENQKNILFVSISVLILSILVENLYFLTIYGDDLSLMYRNIEYYRDGDTGVNFVGTSFYNALIFFIGIMFYKTMEDSSRIHKIIYLTALLLSYYFMLSIETRATSLLLSVSLLFLVYFNKQKSKGRNILIIILSFMLILTISLWLPALIDILPERVAVRITALTSGNNSDNEYLSRFGLAMVDINTFTANISNFFIGVGDHRGHEYWNVIGQHSYILDTLAKYGCIGIMYLLTFFRLLHANYSAHIYEKNEGVLYKAIFVIFIICGITSHAFDATIGLTAFLLLSTITNKKI